VLVVGIIISAGEYRHGTAADTFLTTPRRHRVLAAKLAVGAGVGLATGALTSLACDGVAGLLYNAKGATFPFDDVEVWLTLAGAVAYTTLFAVLGVALAHWSATRRSPPPAPSPGSPSSNTTSSTSSPTSVAGFPPPPARRSSAHPWTVSSHPSPPPPFSPHTPQRSRWPASEPQQHGTREPPAQD